MKGYGYYYKKKNKSIRYFLLAITAGFLIYLGIKNIPHLPFFHANTEKYTYIEKMINKHDKQTDRLKKKVTLSKINKVLSKLLDDQDRSEDGTLAFLAGSVNYRKGLLEYNKDIRNMYLNKAIYYYRKALALLKVKKGRLHYELGKSYFYKGEYYYYESLLELEKAKILGYGNKKIDKIIAIIKLKKGDISDISHLLKHFKNTKEGEVESYFSDAITYKKNKDYNKAIENFQKIVAFYLKNEVENEEKKYIIFKTYYNLGWLYYTRKDYSKAEEYYNIAVKYDDNNADLYYWLGKVYESKKKKKMAKKMYIKALNIDSNHKYAKIKLKKLRRGK